MQKAKEFEPRRLGFTGTKEETTEPEENAWEYDR